MRFILIAKAEAGGHKINSNMIRTWSRRDWLKGVVGIGTGAAFSGCRSLLQPNSDRAELVRRENEQPGTRDWLLARPRIDSESRYRCPWIEGYCSHRSIRAGENLSLFVSTNPESEFTIEIYRMGYYGGDGGRLMSKLGPFRGQVPPEPAVGRNRLR